MSKRPAYLFYPNDWRTDPELCRCSKSARDTWMDMNCLMHFCEEYGVLVTGGKAWPIEEIAAAVRGPYVQNLADINELLDKGVAHRRQDGALFCKRMVRDEQQRQQGNERVKRFRNVSVTPMKHCSSSSVSSSVSSSTVKPTTTPLPPKGDGRHATVRDFIQQSYNAKFEAKCPWDGSEAKALERLLKANPSWSADDFERMVRNRFDSEGVTGTRPRVWLPRLSDYTAALDRFKNAKGTENGRAQQRQNSTFSNIEAAVLGKGAVDSPGLGIPSRRVLKGTDG